MEQSFKAAFVTGAEIPIQCGVAVDWNLRTYVLVHVEEGVAYLLSIYGEDKGKKYKVPVSNIIRSACDVCFAQ